MATESFTINAVTGLPTQEGSTADAGVAGVGGFPDDQTDETHDQGFGLLDYGDLASTGAGTSFSTTMTEGGAAHVIRPGLALGSSVDGERDGLPSTEADGDDASNTGSANDEDGITFVTPLLPGYDAGISVSAINTTGSAAVLQGWIDWNGDGQLSAGEELTLSGGGQVAAGGLSEELYTFPVPASATFNSGRVYARFRLSPAGGQTANGPDKYDSNSVLPQGEVEDYTFRLGNVGNYVWEDINGNGRQDEAPTAAMAGIPMELTYFGLDGIAGGSGANADRVYTTTTTALPQPSNKSPTDA